MNVVRFGRVVAGILIAAGLSASAGCARPNSAGTEQRVAITVTDKGFEPAKVTVHAGRPVTLVVTRKTERTCATELVLKEHAIHQALPLDQPVEIRFTPNQPGDLTYACGMDMIRGQIAVR